MNYWVDDGETVFFLGTDKRDAGNRLKKMWPGKELIETEGQGE